MIIANKELLDAFVQKHSQPAGPLNSWVEKVKKKRSCYEQEIDNKTRV